MTQVLSAWHMFYFVLFIRRLDRTILGTFKLCALAGGGARADKDVVGSATLARRVNGKQPSILVTLFNRELVHWIIRAKNAYSYFSTNDLDTCLLDPIIASGVPANRKI